MLRSQWGLLGKLMLAPLVTPGFYSARRYPQSLLGSSWRPDTAVSKTAVLMLVTLSAAFSWALRSGSKYSNTAVE